MSEENIPSEKDLPDLPKDGDPLCFDLELAEHPVELKGKDGVTQKYVLRELDGKDRDKYLNNLSGRTRTDNSGKVTGVKNFDGLQAALVTRCLFLINEHDDPKTVSEKEIQAFPARVQTALFDKAKSMSGLDDEAEDKAKND